MIHDLRRRVGRGLARNGRRLAVELANVGLNHDALFRGVGMLNRRVRLIEGVFLVYPAEERYGHAYAFRRRLNANRWRPWPVGVLWQNRRATLMFGVSSYEELHRDPRNSEQLNALVERMDHLRTMFGAQQKTFAGALPGILAGKGILHDPPEGDLAARMVAQAVEQLLKDDDHPVVVLGGRGFVGRRLVERLRGAGIREVIPVDVNDSQATWPTHLANRPLLLVNVATRSALSELTEQLWPEVTVLNEVYPEPGPETLAELTRKRVDVYHVVGVRAWAVPPFPAAYAGAIPCCAAWPSEDAQVVVRHLNPQVT